MTTSSGSKPVARYAAEGQQREHDVEVDAAQVGAQPASPVESVGVADVGVERGPHDVEAGAHLAGSGAAVAAAGGVAEFVEAGREDDQREEQQDGRRLVEQRSHAFAQTVAAEQPHVERDEAGQHRGQHGRPEQRTEDGGQRRWWRARRRSRRGTAVPGRGRVCRRTLRRRRAEHDAERPQLLLDQEADVVATRPRFGALGRRRRRSRRTSCRRRLPRRRRRGSGGSWIICPSGRWTR